MTVSEFLSHLRSKEIELSIDGDKLCYSAPPGGLSPALARELAKRKTELLQFLRATDFANAPIARTSRDRNLPLSFAQQRLWFLDQLAPETSLYNISKAIRLNGPLNLEALQKTLDTIVARHEILRTRIVAIDGIPTQTISESGSAKLEIIDLSKRTDGSDQAELHRLIDGEARRPFNLFSDLMVRATLLRLGENDCVLVLVTHHIASDGWSMSIFLGELAALYGSFSTGKPSPLSELPIQYADYAVWQREWLQGEVLQAQLSYWKKQLSGVPVLELPTDRPRPAAQTFPGAHQSLVLPKTLGDDLKSLGRKSGATPFMTLLAAFQALLHRYTGQEDIAVGSPIANRTRSEIEGLIGFFVNTVVLRTGLSGDPTFQELLARVREVALDAYEHQDLPFEKLVEELHPDRNLSHNPLFQVMFSFQNVPRSNLSLPGLSASTIDVDADAAKFDLTLSMAEAADSLTASFQYNTDLFEGTTIARMLRHFRTLLEGVVADPDRRLSDLPILSEGERRQLLAEWNDTRKDYPRGKCIHELFEAEAERSPDAVAVVFQDKQLTYRELNRRANQLARYLQKRGVGPEVLVGICMERSLDTVVGLLGILKAGGAYLPLDPAYPKERIAFMLEDTKAQVLLSQQSLLANLPESKAQVIRLDSDWETIAADGDGNPVPTVTEANLAYVIYTSGSTGQPKGVAIAHRSTVTLLRWARTIFTPEDLAGVLASTSICFDLSVFELFMPLSWGGKVILAKDVLQLPALRAAGDVTLVNTVPSAILELLRIGAVPAAVRTISLAGEPLRTPVVKQIYEQRNVERVFDLYGPSEDTTYSTWALRKSSGPATIGRPVANTEIYILDPHLQPVPLGVPGELHIGGMGLARCYMNRPDLTAEKFIPHPFSAEPGARLYKTGDLARYLVDGNIELLGRIDHQVKIRGFRIELGEIESVLVRHPAVHEAVVAVREDGSKDLRLVAYVVPKRDSRPELADLRGLLKSKLPDYMIPSAFVLLDVLPLTPNGKVDRRALPAPEARRPESGNRFVPPADALELQLTKIWEEVLGVKPIGVKDNFFDLGGHSLLAVRLFAQIRKLTGKNPPLAALFRAPTVEELARIIREQEWSAPWSALVAIQPGGSKPPFFCVHAHDGHVLYYRYLAGHLGKDQPFYGLQAVGLDGKRPPYKSVEEMASHYIKEILALQPQGPYFLGANCAGGKIVFEMAQQLHAQGHKVALLALIDCHAPGCHGAMPESTKLRQTIRYLAQKTEHHLINLSLLGYYEKLTYIRGTARWWYQTRIQTRIDRLLSRNHNGEADLDSLPVEAAIFQALKDYVPKVYPGRITLFRPAKQDGGVEHEPAFGWGRFAGAGVEVHTIQGYHEIIQEPRARVLAERLRACLQRPREGAEGKCEMP